MRAVLAADEPLTVHIVEGVASKVNVDIFIRVRGGGEAFATDMISGRPLGFGAD